MADEIDPVVVLEKLENLQKEHETLQVQKEQMEKELASIKEKQKEEETRRLIEELVKKTGKPVKEFEGKTLEVLKELLVMMPEKKIEEKAASKGIVETKVETPIKEKEIFEVDKSGDLSMTGDYWKEFDSKIRDLSYVETYKYLPNKKEE